MLKQISIISIASAILLLSGCGAKPEASMLIHSKMTPTAQIKVNNGAGTPSWASNERKAFTNILEASAKVTLKKGYKYFVIVKPSEIANKKGFLKNTAKELLEFCTSNPLMVLNIGGGLHKCGTYNTEAKMTISMYNEEQEEFTVIDAQKVLDYYETNDLSSGDDVKIQG